MGPRIIVDVPDTTWYYNYMNKNMKQYDDECRDAFRIWLENQGMRLNPEGFQYSFRNQDHMTRAQHIGMNLWLNDFRALFAPTKHG